MSLLKNKTVSKETANILGAGRHDVRIAQSLELTDRFSDLTGKTKKEDEDYSWVDETPQLALTYANDSGVITHRYNLKGFVREEEVADEDIKSGKIEIHSGYACKTNKAGDLVRMESKNRTEKCWNILNSVFNALGVDEGADMESSLVTAIAQKSELSIEVFTEEYDGNDILKIKNPRTAGFVTEGKLAEAETF